MQCYPVTPTLATSLGSTRQGRSIASVKRWGNLTLSTTERKPRVHDDGRVGAVRTGSARRPPLRATPMPRLRGSSPTVPERAGRRDYVNGRLPMRRFLVTCCDTFGSPLIWEVTAA